MAYVIGLMSGTSLDGCDAALVEITEEQTRLVAYAETPMPADLREKILNCCSPEKSNVALVCSLNAELGYWFASAANNLCQQAGISPSEIECIGSHGQTVWHIPTAEKTYMASTLQIGEPAIIAYETGIPVVSSFRAMDMAAGGRGAPLVPYPEYLLYRGPVSRALQNIGGIANVTALPANCTLDEVFAFDTGPGNMIIDAFMRLFYNETYDKDGAIAASGRVDEEVIGQWMRIPFITAAPPKATGREVFGSQFVQAALQVRPAMAPEDWVATATCFTACSIAENYQRYIYPKFIPEEVVLSGGGSHNKTLRKWLEMLLPESKLLTQEDLGWPSDAKEAVAFAIMAHETMNRRPGNAPSATGASKPVILGNITPAPLK